MSYNQTNTCSTVLLILLTFIQALLCSSLQLWIAVLTRLADSMWQLVISRQCSSKHDLCVALKVSVSGCCRSTAAAPCPVCGLPPRPRVYRKVTDSCGCRGQSASHWSYLHTLMRPYSLFLVFITQQSGKCACMCVCVYVRVWQKNRNYRSSSVCSAYVQCLCGCGWVWLCMCVCGRGGSVGYFYSCYILWQRCDSTFRSVQTMWLTQHCSPQPQCKSHFLKPVPWHTRLLHITSLLIKRRPRQIPLAAHSTCMHSSACSLCVLCCARFRHKNHANLLSFRQQSGAVRSWDTEKEVQKSTHISSNTSVHNAQRTVRKGEREVFEIMNGQHCTTDALLFGVVQSSGILLILRKRLAGSFPVYWTNPL